MELHLDEAARLMGIEVVEDAQDGNPCAVCRRSWKGINGYGTRVSCKDDCEQLKKYRSCKPRIAQVLGVEIGEPFDVLSDNGTRLYANACVCKDKVVRTNIGSPMDGDMLCRIIDGELTIDRIIRRPHFTQDEIALASILHRRGVTELFRKEGHSLYWRGAADHGRLPMDLFSSIRVGETIRAEEIIQGSAAGKERRK